MIELPYLFIQTIIYGVIVYVMIGFEWTVAKFFWYLFFMYFTLLYFTLYGMMTVAVTPNHSIAAIISSAFYAIWNLFCGFVVPKTVSSILEHYWKFWTSFFGSMINLKNSKLATNSSLLFFLFYNRECQCGGDGIITFAPFLGHYMD